MATTTNPNNPPSIENPVNPIIAVPPGSMDRTQKEFADYWAKINAPIPPYIVDPVRSPRDAYGNIIKGKEVYKANPAYVQTTATGTKAATWETGKGSPRLYYFTAKGYIIIAVAVAILFYYLKNR